MDSEKDLPDLPHTPMRDGRIDEGAMTSSGADPPDPKRPRPMTPAERQAKRRAKKPESMGADERGTDPMTTSGADTPDPKQPRPMTPAERQAKKRAKNREATGADPADH